MTHKRRTTYGQLTAAAIDDTEFERWAGRRSAVAFEGKRAVGLGAVLQTQDTLTYLSLAEVAAIVENATMLAAGDRVTATVVAPPQPLPVLYRKWAQMLEMKG